MAAAADSQPTLVLVDDFQWIDSASKAALAFTVRRLRAENIAVIFTARSDDITSYADNWIPSIQLTGLDTPAIKKLITAGGRAVSTEAMRRLITSTGGNPLALQYALTVLDQKDQSELLVQPAPIEPMLERSMRRQLDALPRECRKALLLLAIEPDDPVVLTRALRLMDSGPEALLAAEQAGLVALRAGQAVVTHPLVHSAVYHSASADDRRAAHQAVSAALTGWSAPLQDEKRALHRALGAATQDPVVAADLEQAATTAIRGGRLAAASELLERAGQLSPDHSKRCACTIQAAELAFLTGQVHKVSRLLDHAMSQVEPSNSLYLRCCHLQSKVAMWQGHPQEAYQLLLTQSSTLRAGDPATISAILSDVGISALMMGDCDTAERCARDGRALSANLAEEQTVPVRMLTALLDVIRGDVGDGRKLATELEPLFYGRDKRVSGQWTLIAGLIYSGMDDLKTADGLFKWVIDQARQLSAPTLLPFPLSWHAKLAFRRGDWAQAAAWAQEAVDLARSTQNDMSPSSGLGLPDSLATLALIEAGLGLERECRQHTDEILADSTSTQYRPVDAHAHLALGVLDLGNLNYETAYLHLRIVREFCQRASFGETTLLPWAADLAEAAERSGRSAEASDAVAILEQKVARANQPVFCAALARSKALSGIVPTRDKEQYLEQATNLYVDAGYPFEQARAELHWGELLRRNARPREARDHFAAAQKIFTALGAQHWATRAASELRAAGGRVKRAKNVSSDLTSQELRVALTIAEGLSNAQAASKLFLSQKTIEYHLSNAFRKLGVQNRAALVAALARTERAGP
jgi:ATP/maltotriose-dependent transcriptional regulator MalT